MANKKAIVKGTIKDGVGKMHKQEIIVEVPNLNDSEIKKAALEQLGLEITLVDSKKWD